MLSTQEYIVLGLISTGPQSGYSIMSTLESGVYRWSASPGSIYPILKRLEKERLIEGQLEMVHELRPRKTYDLTPVGENLLDEWIKRPLNPRELIGERDITMMKFLFAEKRLTYLEILDWLKQYEIDIEQFTVARIQFNESGMNQTSVYIHLILEGEIMELDLQRNWIKLARQRLIEFEYKKDDLH